MSEAEFNRNLIRLPLDYQGTPQLAEIRVTLPSFIVPHADGGDFDIGLELRDRWGFHIPEQRARLRLTLEGASGEVPRDVEIRSEYDSHHRLRGRATEKNAVIRVRAFDLETGIEAISNPAWLPEHLSSADHKLYWGDLHAHRIEVPAHKLRDPLLWSYGPATVHEFYQFARDVVYLDFAALTDHDYSLTTDEWRLMQEGARYYDQPGDFATFLAYEWGWNDGPSADHGHRHILYLRDDMPLVSAGWHGSNTPQDLFATLRKLSPNGSDILSIPHHSARLMHRIWYDWQSMDPHFERLMEVYSIWGSSEHQGEPYPLKSHWEGEHSRDFEAIGHFLQDGLRLGHKFGFVGGSESHDGRAGNPVMHGPDHLKSVEYLHRPGLTGIWARRNTRDCLWSSLWNRRTMATTGARITLDFDIDDQPMGAVIKVTRPPKELRVRVLGTDALASVVVVRNNEDWHTVTDPGWNCCFTRQELGMPEELTDWYYVRVVQQDGNMAWSSPIWIVDER